MEHEKIAKDAQACFQECPTIILGSGASIAHGLPSMEDLSDYLRSNLKTDATEEDEAWYQIEENLDNGDHLEAALEKTTLPSELLSKLVNLTWQCVNDKDMRLLHDAVLSGENFPLGQLLSGLFNSTQCKFDIVTTNYDRVAEYACNSVGLLFQTGFKPGYVQNWESNERVKYYDGYKPSRVVDIWKVHGSLDWFRIDGGKKVGLPLFDLPSTEYTPLIVTPGLSKYEKTYDDPFRTTIAGADKALKEASAFLCIGFGFRDVHIQPIIEERCQRANVPIVVLAKKLTEEARKFLTNNAGTNYLGIEHTQGGSRVYSPEYFDGVNNKSPDMWTLSGFNNLVM